MSQGAEEMAVPRRQRVAAYAVLARGSREDTEVLLTRMSSHTRIQGRWTLPGGGIDHGEDPRDAVRREVYEETGLRVEPGEVIDVHSTHFTGARADGLIEDYHGVHLIFAARLLPESTDVEPHVVELDGSTDLAVWVPLADAFDLDLLGAARHALEVARDGRDRSGLPGLPA
jgi:8-oxo-dGTP diphosphatase